MKRLMKFKKYKTPYFLSLLFFTSLGFGQFYFELGFALKPYMIITMIIAVYMLLTARRLPEPLSFKGVGKYEYLFILFLTVVGLSFLWSQYPDQSIRFSANAILLISVYLVLRLFYSNFIDMKLIGQSLKVSACIVFVSSLAYYLIGMAQLSFDLTGNGIRAGGLMMDRSYPRLIGTMSSDPNFAALILSVFFAFIIFQRGALVWKVLGLVAIILTFSRGAYLSLILSFLVFGALSHIGFKKILSIIRASLIVLLGVLLVFGGVSKFTDIDVGGVISGRIDDSMTDGGSGRSTLWNNALTTFGDHALFGIGANASLLYNMDTYRGSHYNHNTYLDVLSELGVLGMGVFVLFMFALFLRARRILINGEQYPILVLLIVFSTLTFLTAMTNEMIMLVVLIVSIYSTHARDKTDNKRWRRA